MGYDQERYHNKRTLLVGESTGFTVAGTSAAITKFRMRCPKAMAVTGATWCALTGGTTAAVSTITIGKSLAGTGAVASMGTFITGTQADNASGAVTISTTGTAAGGTAPQEYDNELAAGDHLVVVMSGTSAAPDQFNLAIEWVEDFG